MKIVPIPEIRGEHTLDKHFYKEKRKQERSQRKEVKHKKKEKGEKSWNEKPTCRYIQAGEVLEWAWVRQNEPKKVKQIHTSSHFFLA